MNIFLQLLFYRNIILYNRFNKPAKTITIIGFFLYFIKSTKHITNINNICNLRFSNINSFNPKADCNIFIPDIAIKTTTAGLKTESIVCSIVSFLYFIYIHDRKIKSRLAGSIQPKVATNAPGIPPILIPTKVAEFTAIGPGVICDMVIRSVNSSKVSQWYVSTTSLWMMGIAA